MPPPSPDVIVVGGGPAGSSAATMLARQGVRVLLLERARFPRDHVGESLLPASIPVLEELGVMPAIKQEGFLPKWGATMVWGVPEGSLDLALQGDQHQTSALLPGVETPVRPVAA